MIRTPIFAIHAIDAFFSSLTSTFSRVLTLFIAGGFGNLLGHLCSFRPIPDSDQGGLFGLIAYPLILFMNLYDPLGIVITGIFVLLLLGTVFWGIGLYHAIGIILPLQAMYSFSSVGVASPLSVILLFAAVSPFFIIYFCILWHRSRAA